MRSVVIAGEAAALVAAWWPLAAGALVALGLYAVLLLALLLVGRRSDAAALARFVPDCAVLFARFGRDPRVSLRSKLVLLGLVAYLACPLDLVPDFVPVVGVADDAILVALALRFTLRRAGPALLREHWPGSDDSLRMVERLAGARAR